MSSLEKAEIAQDTLAIMLGGEPAVWPVRPDWRQSTVAPDRTTRAGDVGEYQTPASARNVYQDGDKLLGSGGGLMIEFVPLSGTQFVMLSDVST
jgi:hypothetical protein